jgi:hypothetical protein
MTLRLVYLMFVQMTRWAALIAWHPCNVWRARGRGT